MSPRVTWATSGHIGKHKLIHNLTSFSNKKLYSLFNQPPELGPGHCVCPDLPLLLCPAVSFPSFPVTKTPLFPATFVSPKKLVTSTSRVLAPSLAWSHHPMYLSVIGATSELISAAVNRGLDPFLGLPDVWCRRF